MNDKSKLTDRTALGLSLQGILAMIVDIADLPAPDSVSIHVHDVPEATALAVAGRFGVEVTTSSGDGRTRWVELQLTPQVTYSLFIKKEN